MGRWWHWHGPWFVVLGCSTRENQVEYYDFFFALHTVTTPHVLNLPHSCKEAGYGGYGRLHAVEAQNDTEIET